MFWCPRNCARKLVPVSGAFGSMLGCPSCQGRALNVATIKYFVSSEDVTRLWVDTKKSQVRSPILNCPSCNRSMIEGRLYDIEVDVCHACHWLWLDRGELSSVSTRPEARLEVSTEKQSDQAFAKAKLEQAKVLIEMQKERTSMESGDVFRREQAADLPHWYLTIFGMQVETNNPIQILPVLTWGFMAIFAAVFLFESSSASNVVESFGFLPRDPWRTMGFTWLSSIFLHANFFHLLGNTYMFMIFGDNVEERLGRIKFLTLFFTAGIVGNISHMIFDPRPDMVCVGASGAISGIMMFYALSFPRARLASMYFFQFFSYPAWGFMIVWTLFQLLGFWQELNGLTAVSASAHLGGVLVGFLGWAILRLKS